MRKMTETFLSEAFAGESMAHMKYLAYSVIAKKEGFEKVARLFEAIAYAEQVHAINHAKVLGLLKNTLNNLESGVDGENFEINEMYPAYGAVADLQEEKGAKRSIHYAVEAEKIHEELYKMAKADVAQGKDIDIPEVYVCEICGHTHIGEPPERCPICNVTKDKYKEFK